LWHQNANHWRAITRRGAEVQVAHFITGPRVIVDLNLGEALYLEVRDEEVRLIFVAKDKGEAIAIAETVARKFHSSKNGPTDGPGRLDGLLRSFMDLPLSN
jgi:hypothetical protein